MLNAKEAATIAINFFRDFYEGSGFSDIKVEEIEFTDDNKWLITLGYIDQKNNSSMMISFGTRKFKILSFDQNGVVKSMKIRTVE